MTWASLCLECTGFVLVWFRPLRPVVVAAMILLHVGIDMTMNMHIFEWVSIIGWFMFLFESEDKETSSHLKHAADAGLWYQRRWLINTFLVAVLTILFVDTAPLLELYDSLLPLVYNEDIPVATTSPGEMDASTISMSKRALNMLFYMNQWRSQYFNNPIGIPFLYPLGLYQGVWNLYSGAPDTFCRYEIFMHTYDVSDTRGDTSDLKTPDDRVISIFVSPDWGVLNWYEKKRWQRPMTMYEKLPELMCRECFVQYHTQKYLKEQANEQLHIASLRLQFQCERPPPPPAIDDWFNWTGWFYANAKQDVLVPMETSPSSLYVLNFCDDISVDCSRWHRDGLCEAASHSDRFVMTHLCRKSCRLCPEHGYDADHLTNGTRISIVWPVPAELKMFQTYTDDDDPFYFDSTIIAVKDHPVKRYLLKYDDSFYNSEWFDPILLRERGYRLLGYAPASAHYDKDAPESSKEDLPSPGGDEL